MTPRVALVTGASAGIGRGIAVRLAREGWSIVITGTRDSTEAEPALRELLEAGADAIYVRGDVADSQTRTAIVEGTLARFGRIDALVNNAGITSLGRQDFLDATEESFDRVLSVNTKAPFFLSQLVARVMVAQRERDATFRGRIVNVTSVSASVVSVNRGDYCVSKAGLSMATKVMAARLGEFGIDCFEVRPGLILTDMTSAAKAKYDQLIADGITVEPRWGTPDDVGLVVASVLRGDLPYSTGQVLVVDGGLTIDTL